MIIVKVLYEKRELDTLPGASPSACSCCRISSQSCFLLSTEPGQICSQHHSDVDWPCLPSGRAARWPSAAIVLPKLFHHGTTAGTCHAGALAWCFLIGEIAERLHLSREMGSLVAGVSLSTFPYALDVTAKITTLRDFFITLFFVALGMTIPFPGATIGLALVIAVFTVLSRLLTTFLPLYLMKQGLRASLLPAINLSQISEFSLVVIQVGLSAGHIRAETSSAASFAFAILAVVSTFVMTRSDQITRRAIILLKRIGSTISIMPTVLTAPITKAAMARRGVSSFSGFSVRRALLVSEIERQINPCCGPDQCHRLQSERFSAS